MLTFAASGAKDDRYYERVRAMSKEVATLKRQPGRNIMRYGNGVLDETLVAHKLIDEVQLAIIPVTVGVGRRLFEGIDTSHIALTLKGTKAFKSGIVVVTYACS
jgi:dihydrofolate reductase